MCQYDHWHKHTALPGRQQKRILVAEGEYEVWSLDVDIVEAYNIMQYRLAIAALALVIASWVALRFSIDRVWKLLLVIVKHSLCWRPIFSETYYLQCLCWVNNITAPLIQLPLLRLKYVKQSCVLLEMRSYNVMV